MKMDLNGYTNGSFKKIIYSASLLTALYGCATENTRLNDDIIPKTKDAVHGILDSKKDEKPIKVQEKPEIEARKYFKKISSIKGEPLDMESIHKKNHLSQLIGLNQFENVLLKYNLEIVRMDGNNKCVDDICHYEKHEIVIPYVYDELKMEFPSSLEAFIKKNNEFKDDIGSSKTLLIIKKLESGKFALSYYIDGNLFLATHVSPGRKSKPKRNMKTKKMIPGGSNTPSGVFKITKRDSFKTKKSTKFGSPMPYSLKIHKGIFMHYGENVDGTKKSHGCIRVPGFYQEIIYENIQTGIKIIIQGTD